ncbi:DUF3450 domain-containing protein [Marinobacterium jannaschii]|uniref:DUF3450 domain-containing protein n=1 Tax=Marinobacterium jannaschii TaxID=64970 RepID=UPI0004847D64|nr:DUF3450 domain-containing protein [Marinobacterium jannaschii]
MSAKRPTVLAVAAIIGSAFLSPVVAAATVDGVRQSLESAHQTAAQTQQAINKLDEKTATDYETYTAVLRQAKLVEAYNRQLEKLVDSQRNELTDLDSQLASLAETEQATLPLLVRMQGMLERFVEADLPFLQEERAQRIERLSKLIDRADVSIAEKYRQLLEAYQIEAEYGRTLEAWDGVIEQAGTTRDVRFLRLGRTALYYQSLDGLSSAIWNNATASWQPIDPSLNWSIQKGIRIALQQAVPEMMELPLVAGQ